ncbi:hypothetical protein [Burkholderia catarinensis]|uniref:hypothetical protein n=1 Tax=Burkholderia catarinensis TaxID=1108140 RepID=UPI00091BCCA3|nr:hypothetical protein [Burkholderia catarinensis]KAG8150347.1 hypothetical protein BFF94_028095 [Burkholderia catarinensis]
MRRHVGQLAMLIGLSCASAAQGSAPAARPATNAPRRIADLADLADTASRTSNPWRGSTAKPAIEPGVSAPSAGNYAPLPIERQMRALSIDALGMPAVHRTHGVPRVRIRQRGGNDTATGGWPGMEPPWSGASW